MSTSIKFKYDTHDDYITLIDLGIRSMAGQRIPGTLKVKKEPPCENVIWVNRSMLGLLEDSNQFDGKGVYLADNNNKGIYVHLRLFDFPGTRDWMVMSNQVAWKLGLGANITTVYPVKEPMNQKTLKQLYSASRLRLISWNERLPFFSSILYTISVRYYTAMVAGFGTLILLLVTGILHDTFIEFEKLIQFAACYGASKADLFLFIATAVGFYFFTSLLMGVFLAWGIIHVLTSLLPVLNFMSGFNMEYFKLLMIVPLLCLLSSIFVQKKFNKPILAQEEL